MNMKIEGKKRIHMSIDFSKCYEIFTQYNNNEKNKNRKKLNL